MKFKPTNKCLNLDIIPQFTNTCWFNAILMVSLYSQGLKRVMLKTSKNWDISKNRFYKILKLILKGKNLKEFYNQINPEIILFELLKKENPNDVKLFKSRIKDDIYNLAWVMDYITTYLRYSGVNFLDITYIQDENKKDYYLTNLSKYIKRELIPLNKYNYLAQIDLDKFNLETNESMIKDNTKTPDVIVLFHQELLKNPHIILANLFKNVLMKIPKYKKTTNSFFLNPNNNDIKTYKETIEFKGIIYKLDSCLIDNYNNPGLMSHAIAGITCENQRYVYNGWNYELLNSDTNKCSLMPFQWDLRKNKSFCLDYKTCNFSKRINKKEVNNIKKKGINNKKIKKMTIKIK